MGDDEISAILTAIGVIGGRVSALEAKVVQALSAQDLQARRDTCPRSAEISDIVHRLDSGGISFGAIDVHLTEVEGRVETLETTYRDARSWLAGAKWVVMLVAAAAGFLAREVWQYAVVPLIGG